MKTNEVLQAVKAAIGRIYPGERVYVDELPEGFQRPSFALECQKDEWTDAGIGLVRREMTLRITCFVPVNAYSDSSRETLNARQDAVMGLFGAGALHVGDRALKVRLSQGMGTPDFAEVKAVLSWYDTRPGYVDAEAEPGEGGLGTPMMEQFAINSNVT